MTDLTKRKLKACQVKPINTVPYYEELRELKEENTRQKELLKECQTRITDCLYKIYDEGGHSYPSLEEELKDSLSKLRRYWNEKN